MPWKTYPAVWLFCPLVVAGTNNHNVANGDGLSTGRMMCSEAKLGASRANVSPLNITDCLDPHRRKRRRR